MKKSKREGVKFFTNMTSWTDKYLSKKFSEEKMKIRGRMQWMYRFVLLVKLDRDKQKHKYTEQ